MIGGKVVRVYRFSDRTSVLVQGTGTEQGDQRVIDLPKDAPDIQAGDGIWWQMDRALWTPRDKSVQDWGINRLGPSYKPDALWKRVHELCAKGICPDCGSNQTMFDRKGALWCANCDASYKAQP